MHFTALGGLEGHWTDGALVEELAVLLLDVALLSVEGLKNHVAVETPETGSHDNSLFPTQCVLYFKAFLLGLLTCTKPCARSADSFPSRASAGRRSDTGRRTLDSSTGTCECGCVHGL